jgi:hypothetical protein
VSLPADDTKMPLVGAVVGGGVVVVSPGPKTWSSQNEMPYGVPRVMPVSRT